MIEGKDVTSQDSFDCFSLFSDTGYGTFHFGTLNTNTGPMEHIFCLSALPVIEKDNSFYVTSRYSGIYQVLQRVALICLSIGGTLRRSQS